MTAPRQNSWLARYGEKRREIDKKILATVERQIVMEERQIARERQPIPDTINTVSPDRDLMRAAIAKAFGRPPA